MEFSNSSGISNFLVIELLWLIILNFTVALIVGFSSVLLSISGISMVKIIDFFYPMLSGAILLSLQYILDIETKGSSSSSSKFTSILLANMVTICPKQHLNASPIS